MTNRCSRDLKLLPDLMPRDQRLPRDLQLASPEEPQNHSPCCDDAVPVMASAAVGLSLESAAEVRATIPVACDRTPSLAGEGYCSNATH